MTFTPILAAWNVDWFCYIVIIASVILGIRHRHSFFALPIVVAISLIAGDSFYPLSNFPMYSDPNESENYFYVATWDSETTEPTIADIKPLPIRQLTSITAPTAKKLQKAWIRERADELKISDSILSESEKLKQWQKLLDHLRERVRKGREVPDKLALVEVWIEFDEESGYRETGRIVAKQTSPSK